MSKATLEYWWPVTFDFGLVRSDIETVSAARQQMYKADGQAVKTRSLRGSLDDCLRVLEPLGPAPEKELYLATSFGWTAFYANGLRGSDPFLAMLQLSKEIGVTALRSCTTPVSFAYQAVILEIYDTPDAGGDERGYRRSIAAANDGGRWVFEHSGKPYPFENMARYQARRKRDRFTSDMLESYLIQLGIPNVTDETLQQDGTCRGLLISREPPEGLPRYSLREAKNL